MTRLKAYTVMELIVVMVLSALVISIAYTSFEILSKQYLRYKNSQEAINKILTFEMLLTKDFNNSDYVITHPEGIECVYRDKRVKYFWDENYALRDDNHVIDTFSIKINDLIYSFSGAPVGKDARLVDHIDFVQDFADSEYPFSFNKQYAADFLINYEQSIVK